MTRPVSLILPPLSLAFNAITRARRTAYQRGIFKKEKLNAPVISVGNLTTGGTGKTPLVEWVCRAIDEAGDLKKVCVLTRGYGRAEPNKQVVVSDSREILASSRDAGDEPFMLAKNLLGIASVVSNANRKQAGDWAIANLDANAFVLDDGFQHLRLARDLDIVAIDATNPWGGGKLLPQGRLREPVSSLSRADCVVLTRTDYIEDVSPIVGRVQQVAPNMPVFFSRMTSTGFRDLNGVEINQSQILHEPVAAFCAIGNPTSFFEQLRRENYELRLTRAFADHHQFTQEELNQLVAEAISRGARSLITTQKDAIKLSSLDFGLPCYVFGIRIEIDESAGLKELISRVLSSS